MEAYHVVATHPQLLAGIGDANTQYDVFGNFCRAITPNGTPSPHLDVGADRAGDVRRDDRPAASTSEPRSIVPDGMTARQVAGESRRAGAAPGVGEQADELSDAELADSFYYTLFPNFHPWGAYNRIVYRFRPYGDDHDVSIMECMFLAPYEGDERPPPAPIHWLDRRRRLDRGDRARPARPGCSTRTSSTCPRCSSASRR